MVDFFCRAEYNNSTAAKGPYHRRSAESKEERGENMDAGSSSGTGGRRRYCATIGVCCSCVRIAA
ncbi:MAG: hypothetical protein IJ639_08315 [Ruminococcus sp.]|nr:hypothetical protein [Ruminococcus sp.]